MQPIENVITKTGPNPGATVAIFCGVHGDERAGIRAVDRLVQQFEPVAGTVHFVYANPPAIEKNVRMVNANLNRLFLRRETPPVTYEHRRAAQLMDLLDECDALLDLHSYSSPIGPDCATPFAICEPPSFPIAALFDVPVVVSGFTAAEGGGSDGYMFLHGKPGICVELGANECPEAFVDLGIATAKKFLAHFGCIAPAAVSVTASAQQHLALTTFHKKTHDDFRFVRPFRNMETLAAGEAIAAVNGITLKASADCRIIFPNADRAVGIEAFMLATAYEKSIGH